MNREEFKELASELRAIFPTVARQFEKSDEAKSVVAAAWFDVLKDSDLADAKEAAQRILRGTEPEPPKFQDHAWPRHLVGICRKLRAERSQQQSPRRRFVDGEESFRCLDCKDTGWVTVFDRRHVLLAMRGQLGNSRAPNETKILCDCRDWKFEGKLLIPQRLVRGRDVIVNVIVACRDRYAYLCEQVEANRLQEPTHSANYESSFDEYNASESF